MKPRVFLDASVFVAAAGSPSGGSALVFELCRQARAIPVASLLVLEESERNIAKKLGRTALLRFYQEIGSIDLEVTEPPDEKEVAAQSGIINAKDAPVLAGAMKAKVDCLLTLDRKDFLSPVVLEAGLPFEVMTPGSFLTDWLKKQEE